MFKYTSAEQSTSQEGKLGALKSAQLIRNRFQRARPNLGRTYRERESPVAHSLAAPIEEEANKGKNLPVAEDSEETLSLKVRILSRYFLLYFLMLVFAPAVLEASE